MSSEAKKPGWKKIDEATLAELAAQGLPRAEIASRMSIHVDSVSRTLMRIGMARSRNNKISAEQYERMRILVAEGMPATWIAEDIGCDRSTVTSAYPFGKEAKAEWARAWSRIRNSSALLELHKEFAP